MISKRVSLVQIYNTPTGSKWGVKLDNSRLIGNIERSGDSFFYYSFPSTHILRPAPSFYRALLACVKSYVLWIGNYGRI